MIKLLCILLFAMGILFPLSAFAPPGGGGGPPGGSTTELDCSSESFKDDVVINEIYNSAGEFIELYFIDEITIPNNDQWQLCYIKDNNQDTCVDWPEDNQTYSADTYEVYDLPASAGINTTEAEVVLLDGNGDVLDAWRYCNEASCDEMEWSIPAGCLSVISSHDSSNKDMARRPDGTGTPQDNGSDHTKGTSNDGGGGGDPDPVVASGFNCIHSSAVDSTGRLYTRIVNSAFTVDVAALKADETLETDYASDEDRDVTVQLVESDCSTAVSSAQTLTFVDADDGRKESASITVSSAYTNVKCLVTDVSESASYCSSDSFAIRPASLTLTTPTLNNSGSSGTPKAAAGSSFSLEVTTVPGYTGTPSVDTTAIDSLPSPGTTGTLTGSFGAATSTVSESTSTGGFTYSEVGNFQFQDYAIRDVNFTSIDQATDCVDNSYSNTINADGKVGCDFGYAGMTDWVGRFTPDYFEITSTNGMLVNNCGTVFSYTGLEIGFATDPMITITAKNTAGDTTVNYTGSYEHLTGTGSYAVSTTSPAAFPVVGAQFSVAVTDNSTAGAVSGNVSLLWDDSSAQDDSSDSFMAASGSNGIFTTYFSGLKITYDKVANNIVAPFTPDATLAATLQVDDGDGVVSSSALSITPQDNVTNPVLVRYGRLNLLNAYGSELQTLPMTMLVEYYNGSATGFVPNSDDSCTVVNNVVITDPVADDLSVNETCIWDSAGNSGSYNCATAGDPADQYSPTPIGSNFNLNLMGPGAGNTGVLNVTADAPDHLEYDWDGTGDTDPTGTASFGIHSRDSKTIFLKEVR